jgi:hypothetical protein
MALAHIHTLAPVLLNSTRIKGVTRGSVETGVEVAGESYSGSPYVAYKYVRAVKPRATFETVAVASSLAACGIGGLSLASLGAGLQVWAQKATKGSIRASGSVHRSYTLRDGILVPVSLSVDHAGDARLGYAATVTYDGTNSPIVISDNQALPTIDANTEIFGMGPLVIGGSTYVGARQYQIDFAIKVAAEGADGDIYDTCAWIQLIDPKITVRGVNQEWLKSTAIPLNGKAVLHASTTIYLRRRGATDFVANNQAQHISITVAGLATIGTAVDASGTNAAEQTLVIDSQHDGTNAPLIINTAATITA